ncbi:MAG: hypothetical protein U0Z26_12920 [Anaerolineales bacterium]
MPSKIPAIISTVVTIILLILFAVVMTLFEVLALNGASESQGTIALGVSLGCQGLGLILIGILTWRFTNFLIGKFNWNQILAVIVVVISGTLLGLGISVLASIISIFVAGVR